MEYEVSHVFEKDGKRYRCVLGDCEQCAFRSCAGICNAMSMVCEKELRADHTDVRFAEVSK